MNSLSPLTSFLSPQISNEEFLLNIQFAPQFRCQFHKSVDRTLSVIYFMMHGFQSPTEFILLIELFCPIWIRPSPLILA